MKSLSALTKKGGKAGGSGAPTKINAKTLYKMAKNEPKDKGKKEEKASDGLQSTASSPSAPSHSQPSSLQSTASSPSNAYASSPSSLHPTASCPAGPGKRGSARQASPSPARSPSPSPVRGDSAGVGPAAALAPAGAGAAAASSSSSSPSSKPSVDDVEKLVSARLADGSTSTIADLHMEKNSIIISIVGATNLKNVELVGKSDPWVKVKLMDRSGLKERTFKTKFIRNNLNPKWDEEFYFIFKFGRSIEDYLLQLEVYDHDTSSDTFMGQATQSVMDIMGKRPGRVMEMKLEPKKAGQKVKGTISCSVRYPSREEIEDLGANFSGKVAKSLVGYVTYSCADALCRLRPDAAIFECEAEVSVFNIVFIYVLSILIPRGSPMNLFEIKKDMALETLKGAVMSKTSSKGKSLVQSLPENSQKALANFLPKFVDQMKPILEASRKAPSEGGGTEIQMGVGVKPIIRIPPPPAPAVVGAEIALKAIFASMGAEPEAPPPTTLSAMSVARDPSVPLTPQQPSEEVAAHKMGVAPPKPAGSSSSQPRLGGVVTAQDSHDAIPAKGDPGWKPAAENLGILDAENNSVIIRVEGVAGIQHKDITGKCKPYIMVDVTDKSGAMSKKFKTPIKEGQDATFDEDFLFIFPIGRSVEDFIVQFNVYHHALPKKRFLGFCENRVVDIMGDGSAETCEMELQPKKAGDYVKGSCKFSIRWPSGKDVEEIGASVSSQVTKHLVSYILYSCADSIVKGATLPSCVRFECEAEITFLGICFIFIMGVSIPYGTPPTFFENSKSVSFENLRISVAHKGVPKMFGKVPASSQKMVDGYLPKFMEQLMPVVESSRKPMSGDPVFLEFGLGMKPGFALPLPPNPPVLQGTIAFIVFLGMGGREVDMSIKPTTFKSMLNRPEEAVDTEAVGNAAEIMIREAKKEEVEGVKAAPTFGALDVEKGALIIDIKSAKGLRNVDLHGKSDPWVKVRVLETGGRKLKMFGTQVIDNCLDPVWNEHFLFVLPFNRTMEDLALVLEVYDKGLTGKTFLGMAEQSFANVMRNDAGKTVEMELQPKKKGDHVKGTIQFSIRTPTSADIEEIGGDMPSRLARNLISYIAFAFANAIVKMKPRNARFEAEAEISVFGMCFIFCATIVIPLGTSIDCFEMKRDKAYEQLEVCVANQSKKIFQKIPGNAQSMLKSLLPRFMAQAAPLVEQSRDPSEHKIQAQTGIGIKPEFSLPFPPSPAIVTGSLALRAIFGIGSHATAAPFRSFAFHKAVKDGDTSNLRRLPETDD